MDEQAMNKQVFELRVALTTADYQGVLKFFQEGLGLEPAGLWTSGDEGAVIFELGKATLEIFDEAHAAVVDQIETETRTSGPIRFALQVSNVETALKRLAEHGAKVVHAPVLTPWGDINARVQTPDGIQVTLFQSTGKGK